MLATELQLKAGINRLLKMGVTADILDGLDAERKEVARFSKWNEDLLKIQGGPDVPEATQEDDMQRLMVAGNLTINHPAPKAAEPAPAPVAPVAPAAAPPVKSKLGSALKTGLVVGGMLASGGLGAAIPLAYDWLKPKPETKQQEFTDTDTDTSVGIIVPE